MAMRPIYERILEFLRTPIYTLIFTSDINDPMKCKHFMDRKQLTQHLFTQLFELVANRPDIRIAFATPNYQLEATELINITPSTFNVRINHDFFYNKALIVPQSDLKTFLLHEIDNKLGEPFGDVSSDIPIFTVYLDYFPLNDPGDVAAESYIWRVFCQKEL